MVALIWSHSLERVLSQKSHPKKDPNKLNLYWLCSMQDTRLPLFDLIGLNWPVGDEIDSLCIMVITDWNYDTEEQKHCLF